MKELQSFKCEFQDGYKYVIIYSDKIIKYDELLSLDNAVSVCSLHENYIILLDNGKLVYIVRSINIKHISYLIKKFNNIFIEYICNNDCNCLIYSSNKLYSTVELKESYCIKVYDNVIGYLTKYNILLILHSDFKIQCICNNNLYRINSEYPTKSDKRLVDYDATFDIDHLNLLRYIDIADISHVNIQYNKIYIVYGCECILFGTYDKYEFYDSIKHLTNIKQIDFNENVEFCLLKDNTLVFKCKRDTNYLDVIKYLVIDNIVVCFHSNNSLTVINIQHYTTPI